jgi:hypothetical protein
MNTNDTNEDKLLRKEVFHIAGSAIEVLTRSGTGLSRSRIEMRWP